MSSQSNARTARYAADAARYREQGHQIVDMLADHLATCGDDATHALHPAEPEAIAAEMLGVLAGGAGNANLAPRDIVARALRYVTDTQHPRFLGHQVSGPAVDAAVTTLLSGMFNNGSGVFEMGPWAAGIERALVAWALSRAGFTAGDGIVTSGGSVGNLTALLAARQRIVPGDAWRDGARGEPLAILTSTESHYSVGRAARILGLGDEGVVGVPVDAHRRLDAAHLEASLAAARARGRRVFALVVSAASTATGAYDAIEPAADFAQKHGLWLHVDGAHGAAALLSPRYAPLMRGVERADSLVWDAHKMMRVPSLATFVLYRERAASYAAFAQHASYLFDEQSQGYAQELPWYDGGLRTLECTKPALGLPLFTLLACRGEAFVREHIERSFDLGGTFARMLAAEPDFEVAGTPSINIVCFRHVPKSGTVGVALSEHQRRVRKKLLENGRFYIVQTNLGDETWLRVTLINHDTRENDLRELVHAIRAAAS